MSGAEISLVCREAGLMALTEDQNIEKAGMDEIFVKHTHLMKSLQDVIDKVKAEVMPSAMELFDSVGESSVDVNGVKIYKNSGGRYDYSDNTEIKELDSRIKTIQEMMKQAYEAEKNGASFVTDDGEIVSAAKFIPNKPSLTIKF